MFGGSAEPWTGSAETQPKLADTTLLQFSEWLIVCYHIHVYTSVDIVYRVHVFVIHVPLHVGINTCTCVLALVVKLIHVCFCVYSYVYMYMYLVSLVGCISFLSCLSVNS